MKKSFLFLLSFFYAFGITKVVADDIEIYVGTNELSATQANVILMVDTSGSMDTIVSGTNETRMQQTKRALKEMLAKLPDTVNVGLGRYNDPGGSILYPATRLSDTVPQKITKTVESNNNDAFQLSSGVTNISSDTLDFVSGLKTISKKVSYSFDDAVQCTNGTNFTYTGSYIGLYSNSNCSLSFGTIFRLLGIPKNSKIVSSNITLTVPTWTFGNTEAEIFVENISKPTIFSNNYGQRVIDRNYHNKNILWSPIPSSYMGQVTTPDLSALVQENVNRTDWDTNSGINFMFKVPYNGLGGESIFYAYDGSSTRSAYINITYIDSSVGENKVGIKFNDVQVPSNAQIQSAVLKLKAASNNGNGNVNIAIESSNTPSNFYTSNNNISLRTTSTTKTNASFENWNLDSYSNFDITNIVQEKVNSSGWCGGYDMSFILNSKEIYKAYAIEAGSNYAPVLEIKYDSVPNNSCAKSLIVNQLTQSNDDGVQRNNRNVYLNHNNISVSSTFNLSAFLFRKIPLDTKLISNLEIEDAYLEFVSAGTYTTNALFRIYGQKVSNAPALSNSKSSISSLAKTSNVLNWNITSTFYNGETYRTPNITPIIKEIMDQEGWVKNNNLALLIEWVSGSRAFVANDSSISRSAKLVIKYKGQGAFNGLTVREDLSNLIDSLNSEGYTPLDGALYESGLYFMGKPVDYGRSRHPNGLLTNARSKRISEDSTYINGTRYLPSGCTLDNLGSYDCINEKILGTPVYDSPITSATCEVNSIIMITDGYPSYTVPNSYANYTRNDDGISLSSLVQDLTNKPCTEAWSCAGNIAQYLYDSDFNTNAGGKQNVFTHMIGFEELDSNGKLKELARKGGGMFIPANNTVELVSALTKIFNNILDINTTLASPGIAVNQNNKFEHLDEIYYSVFKPSPRQSWNGNIKKYKIDNQNVKIIDANGNEAIDPDTGFFKKGSTSFWSKTNDGDEVTVGGAAEQLAFPKFVFTYSDLNNIPDNEALNTSNNILSESNPAITKTLFELDNILEDDEFIEFLKWSRGVDVNDENSNGDNTEIRTSMGDPLHSRPILLNYSAEKNIVFVSTNHGFLHAIDSESGQEYFSFIPQELLPNLYKHYQDDAGKHIYGLDGSWIALRHDHDEDGDISNTGDYMYLYGGMRMGGRNYYSLDVTNVDKANPQPKLRWTITPNTENAFANMGQTWSEPVIAKIKLNNEERLVMIFGGGYDPAYEDSSYTSLKDTLGNQVYIVDAITGKLIWWASSDDSSATTRITGMNYSIPSKVSIIDLNNDTYIDKIYVGDMGGQVLKFDINNEALTADNLVNGKIIATLGVSDFESTNIANRRKFYEPPALTRVKKNEEKYLAIVMGSGYRSRPLNKQINDTLVMIKDSEDYYMNTSQEISRPYKMSDLYDITDVFNKEILTTQMKTSRGFRLMLKEPTGTFNGEKVLGESVIYNNKIIFNTYIPDGYATRCYPIEGFSRSYQISLFDGSPANSSNIEDVNNINHTDRYSDNVVPGIAAGSKIIYTDNKVIELVNTKVEEMPKGGELGVKKIRWYKKEN